MRTYIALLRGINVSGQKKIHMADLKAHLEELGWEGIHTYIQSGNIIFKSTDGNHAQLAQKIKQKLHDKYGFDVPPLVLSPRADLARKLQEKQNEKFVHDDKVIFLYYPDGYGRTVMNNNAFEKALNVEATTRNWKIINKLYEMTQS